VGSYTVQRPLGAGGYGTVYLAQERDGGLFALKFLALESVGRWGEREVSILLRLQHLAHPNVVRLVSHTLWPVTAPEYLVIGMEYVRGASLDRWAREVNPTARQVAGVVREVARALAAVHGEGVVHRDVKGSNVLVREEDGRAVLVDFGVGGYAGAPGITRHPFLPGTPEYRAPEAWRYQWEHLGQPDVRYEAGPLDDLWALGVTLYGLLTERYPFEAPDDSAMVEAVLHRAPRPPHEVDARVPEALSRVCLRLLEKAPEARYADARAVEAALEEALAGADGAWEVPLCDFHDARDVEKRPANLKEWAQAPHRPPRRGPRPKPEAAEAVAAGGARAGDAAAPPVEAPPEVPGEAGGVAPPEALAPAVPEAPVAPAPMASPEMPARAADVAPPPRQPPSAPRRRWGVAAGLGVLMAAGGVWWGAQLWGEGPSAREGAAAAPAVQEVAPPGRPLEADRATAPPTQAASPVAVASVAAPPEDSAPMKKPPQPPTVPLKKPWKQAGSVAGACLALSCTGPQVRPAPPPQDCPEESLKAMKALGVKIGDDRTGTFSGYTGDPRVITVRGGNASVRMVGGYSDQLRGTSVFSCQVTLSDRVYGRCNWVRNTYGKDFPVCFEFRHRDGALGVERKDDGGDPNFARIFNSFDLLPVERFE
jgi:hypothetical protein